MIDPLGKVTSELRVDAGLLALNPVPLVRPGKPLADDMLGAGQYKRVIVLVKLTRPTRKGRLPATETIIAARCYGAGANPELDASTVANVVSDAFHNKGPRVSQSGVGIFATYDVGGGAVTADPATSQPYETVVISVHAADRPIG